VEEMRAEFARKDAKATFLEERWETYEALFALQLRRKDARGAFATLTLAQGRMFFDALEASLAETGSGPGSRIDAAIGRMEARSRVMPTLADSGLVPGQSFDEIDETLAALRGKHILAYFPALGQMRLMTVVDGEPRITSLALDLEELGDLIDAFRVDPDSPDAAEKLGRALLPPDALPAAPARLHIIPTGPLVKISFAALMLGGERLLDGYEMVYAPSVTGLAAAAAAKPSHAAGSVVLADTRSDLHHVESEMNIVIAHTGALPYRGNAATRDALQEAARVQLLHVISHSGFGPEGGYLALVTGKVTAADIVAGKIGPRLAVLPTCASAATPRREMWDSLAAAFLAAGSRHVVATVAGIEDSVGVEFTRLFYGAGGARDPVAAVASAQRDMADRYLVDAWSAFVVAGL